MEPINNAALLSCLLKNNTELINAIKSSFVNLSIFNEKTRITFHCESVELSETLFSHKREIIENLEFLGYEIYIGCAALKSTAKLERSHAEKEMIALEQQENTEATEDGLLGLENLANKTGTPIKEIRAKVARLGEAIYPKEDGSEWIKERAFNKIALDWLKGDEFPTTVVQSTAVEEEPLDVVKAVRRSKPKLLTQKMGAADIATSKGKEGVESAGAIATTLKTFFGRLKLEDSTLTDAVAAFIEGQSEYGKALRKEILGSYKRHFKGANQANIENKLVVGAKQYLEQTTNQQTESVESV